MQDLPQSHMFENFYNAKVSAPSHDQLFKEVTVKDKKIYYCLIPDCGKSFKFKSEMKRHLVIHSAQRPFVCSFPGCGKNFKRSDALSNHIRIHTRKTPFNCPVAGCSEQFSTKSALRYHLLKHKGEKTFKCTIPGCAKSFLTYAQLKQHEKAAYYHQKVAMSNSPTDQSSPVQLSVQNSDGIGSFEDEQVYGNTSADGIDSSEFEELDLNFEDMMNNQAINEPSGGSFEYLNNKYGHLDETYEDVKAAPVSTDFSEASTASKQSSKRSLIDMLSTILEENRQLKKKLKYNTDILQSGYIDPNQPRDQDEVDLFFKSSFGLEEKEDPNHGFQEKYFFENV